MRFIDILMYLMLTCCATALGACYAMAVETMRKKNYKLFWVYILSVLITPFGAWVVATVVRSAEVPAPVEAATEEKKVE